MNRISEDVKVYLLNPQAGSADFDNLFGKQEIDNKPNTPAYTPCYLDKRWVLKACLSVLCNAHVIMSICVCEA